MRIDSSGNLSVGTTTTPTQITFNGSSGITYQRSTDNSFAGVLDYLKSRGSAASPTAVQNGDDLFQLRVAPYQGSAYTYLNSQVVSVDGTFTSGQNPPTRIVWYTNTANGSATERARIDSSGNVQTSTGAQVVWAPAPAAISTTATLTNLNIQSQIINTTGTSYTVTMPLGTTMETLVPWAAVNLGYNFTVINTASGTITMAVNTGVTSLGALTIATGTSAQFRIRRTAANTFILYRMS
jgi:hypothetical protein